MIFSLCCLLSNLRARYSPAGVGGERIRAERAGLHKRFQNSLLCPFIAALIKSTVLWKKGGQFQAAEVTVKYDTNNTFASCSNCLLSFPWITVTHTPRDFLAVLLESWILKVSFPTAPARVPFATAVLNLSALTLNVPLNLHSSLYTPRQAHTKLPQRWSTLPVISVLIKNKDTHAFLLQWVFYLLF